jgi:hypothetical protein
MRRVRLLLPVWLLVVGLAAGARAEAPVIYKWVDENGVAHYTTDRGRIPSSIRDRVLQGGEAARGADWLRRDAGTGQPTPAAPPPSAALPDAPAAREARDDVELPEDTTGVHAVEAQPDWSQAPGGEASWAPGDLGEEGEPGTTARPAPPAEPPAVQAPAAATRAPDASAAAAPIPHDASAAAAPIADDRAIAPPPPPPPPLEADGSPIAPPAAADEPALAASPREAPAPMPEPHAPELAPAALPAGAGRPATEGDPAEPASEPSTPAVAAPAPRELAPDEHEELAKLDAEIAEMEARIARDEEALMVLISEGEAGSQDALVDDPHFRDIAQRLPKLQADLERLRERRAQIQPALSRP